MDCLFVHDVVESKVAPERGDAGENALRQKPSLQLRQSDVRRLVQRRRDQAGLGIRAARVPVPSLRLRPTIATGPEQPCRRIARRPQLEAGRRLPARRLVRDGGQAARSQINGQRLRHAGQPPALAFPVNQTRSEGESRPESARTENALAGHPHQAASSSKGSTTAYSASVNTISYHRDRGYAAAGQSQFKKCPQVRLQHPLRMSQSLNPSLARALPQ